MSSDDLSSPRPPRRIMARAGPREEGDPMLVAMYAWALRTDHDAETRIANTSNADMARLLLASEAPPPSDGNWRAPPPLAQAEEGEEITIRGLGDVRGERLSPNVIRLTPLPPLSAAAAASDDEDGDDPCAVPASGATAKKLISVAKMIYNTGLMRLSSVTTPGECHMSLARMKAQLSGVLRPSSGWGAAAAGGAASSPARVSAYVEQLLAMAERISQEMRARNASFARLDMDFKLYAYEEAARLQADRGSLRLIRAGVTTDYTTAVRRLHVDLAHAPDPRARMPGGHRDLASSITLVTEDERMERLLAELLPPNFSVLGDEEVANSFLARYPSLEAFLQGDFVHVVPIIVDACTPRRVANNPWLVAWCASPQHPAPCSPAPVPVQDL